MEHPKIKALSIKQPWAWAIAYGHKTIETRTWAANYRGEILICSSLKPDKVMMKDLRRLSGGKWPVIESQLEYGKAIAIATLADCRPMELRDEDAAMCTCYPRAFSWFLENVREIKPFPVIGRQGLYEIRRLKEWSIQKD